MGFRRNRSWRRAVIPVIAERSEKPDRRFETDDPLAADRRGGESAVGEYDAVIQPVMPFKGPSV
jgi:hypothetical protein